jgi:hypothetical protein
MCAVGEAVTVRYSATGLVHSRSAHAHMPFRAMTDLPHKHGPLQLGLVTRVTDRVNCRCRCQRSEVHRRETIGR